MSSIQYKLSLWRGCWHLVISTPSHTIGFSCRMYLCVLVLHWRNTCFPLQWSWCHIWPLCSYASPQETSRPLRQLRRYSPFLCTEQCCTYKCYWHTFGCAALIAEAECCVLCGAVGWASCNLVCRSCRWQWHCCHREDWCWPLPDHSFLTWIRPCQHKQDASLFGGYHSGVAASHWLIGPEVVFKGWSDIWQRESGGHVASECRDRCTQWHLMTKCRLCFELWLAVSISLHTVTSYVWLRHKYCVGPCKWSKLIWLWSDFLVE